MEGKVLGDGGEDVSIVPIVYPHRTVSVSSIGYFWSVGSSSKPSNPSLPLSLRERHIQEYSNNKWGRKRKLIKPHNDKVIHEERIKQSKVIFQARLVVGCWELIPMESGIELLDPQETSTVRYAKDRTTEKKKSTSWYKEDNWTSLKTTLANSHYPDDRGQCDEACLELCFDPVLEQTTLPG